MIRRTRLRVSLLLAVAALAISLSAGSLVVSPSTALAQEPSLHTVTLQIDGTSSIVTTEAPTVSALLAERGIAARPGDFVYPALDVPLSGDLTVSYRAAVPMTIVVAKKTYRVTSSASTVADLLDEQQISLGTDDIVTPALDAALPHSGIVRIVRVTTWERRAQARVPRATLYRLDLSRPISRAHVVAQGRDGVRVTVVSFIQYNGGAIRRRVYSYLERAPRERIIDDGLGPFGAYGDANAYALARHGIFARSKVVMVATAYTAHCYGCSGRTAIGLPAGPGIVAVDPRVIPLGSHLYIPGYGFALAGDTGGDIVGNRVDLGFASNRDAIEFGRREVTVYTLK